MNIYIPSRGRAESVLTYQIMPPELQRKTFIVVGRGEESPYRDHMTGRGKILPINVDGIHRTRQFILEHAGDKKFVMCDDDMKFYRRPAWASPRLVDCPFGEIYEELVEGIRHVPAVGISERQSNRFKSCRWTVAHRMNNIYALNGKVLSHHGIRFDHVPVMEDYWVTLALLRRGIPNAVSYKYAWNQRGSGARGGCSEYRDAPLQAQGAHALRWEYGDCVRVVEKQSRSGWHGLTTRTDVVVSWRKAFAMGAGITRDAKLDINHLEKMRIL